MNGISSAYIANIYGANTTSGNAPSSNRSSTSSQPFFNDQQNQSHPQDKVTLSPQSQSTYRNNLGPARVTDNPSEVSNADQKEYSSPDQPTQNNSTESLEPKQLQELEKLKSRDLEVRQNENAHLAVAGRCASGGAAFT